MMQPDVSRSSVVDEKIRSTNPRTGAALPDVPVTPLAEIPAIIERARTAQLSWGALPVEKRAELLQGVQQEFLAASEELLALLESENGKPRGESMVAELVTNSDLFTFWTQAGGGWLKAEQVPLPEANMPGKKLEITRVPQGVVAILSTWNYPVALPLRAMVPALLAGNAVILKPSEWAPRVGARLAECFTRVLPKDVLIVVQGDGRQGAALISGHPAGMAAPAGSRGVDFVSFTGSVESGALVGQACAARLIPHALELGGKDAAIVRADADLDRTVRGILWGALTNAGQNCAAIERVFVHSAIHDAFVDKMVTAVKQLRCVNEDGTPSSDPEVGPLTMPSQRDKVHALVTEAVGKGARALTGGKIPGGPGRFYPPTVLTGVSDEMRIAREETFGPVIAISKVADDTEAVRGANVSGYGLNASVWTADLAAGQALAKSLRVGVALVNNHCFTASLPMAPWNGRGKSGYGSTNGKDALMELTRPQVVLVDENKQGSDLWWHPYNEALDQIASALLDLGRKGADPQAAMGKLMAAMPNRFPA